MRIEVEIPDNCAEFLKAIATLLKEDPEAYMRSQVEKYVLEAVRSSVDGLGGSPLFEREELAEKYGLPPFRS
jgi:hypothetical protein